MRKILVLASVLSVLGVSGAVAQDFRLSEENSFPVRAQRSTSIDSGLVTAGIPTSGVGSSHSGTVGFSAAQGFGPSDENNLPVPRYQLGANNSDQGIVTSSTGATSVYTGYNAANEFEASF